MSLRRHIEGNDYQQRVIIKINEGNEKQSNKRKTFEKA